MTSVYRQLKTEDCNAKVTEHFSVHVLNQYTKRENYELFPKRYNFLKKSMKNGKK